MDWTTFPDLDCMTAIVFEWGHSMTNEVWAEYKGSMEYKVSVSEFLLHSTKNHFLLKPSDTDSHTPRLLHIAPNWMKFSEKKTYRSKESILQASQSRKERQKAKKRGAPAEPVQGEGRAPPGKGKSKSKEGGSLPSEEPSAVPEPAAPPKAKPAAKPAAARREVSFDDNPEVYEYEASGRRRHEELWAPPKGKRAACHGACVFHGACFANVACTQHKSRDFSSKQPRSTMLL